eukprot:COSAG02_NODE_5827_length_4009_cov_19.149105_4_plen_75_part_00
MSDEEEAQVQDARVDWIIERLEHRPLMFKQDRINKMKIDDNSTCASVHLSQVTRCVQGGDCRMPVSLAHQPCGR